MRFDKQQILSMINDCHRRSKRRSSSLTRSITSSTATCYSSSASIRAS
jgi:hypothetical protein